jgi:endonuclease YncB( thermonuclease family)
MLCVLIMRYAKHSSSTGQTLLVFGPTRYYAIVVTPGGRDLNELLVSSGLARIYGTRTLLPDGRDSREYLAHLHALENEANAAKRGGWSMVQP